MGQARLSPPSGSIRAEPARRNEPAAAVHVACLGCTNACVTILLLRAAQQSLETKFHNGATLPTHQAPRLPRTEFSSQASSVENTSTNRDHSRMAGSLPYR